MEEIEFLDTAVIKEVVYMAEFDPVSGKILSVGPSTAFINTPNTMKIDQGTAEKIIEGEINIFNCAVDVRDMTFELIEKQTIVKMDDVLHRIMHKKWTIIDKPDIHLTVDTENGVIVVELTEEFYGTYRLSEKYQPVIKRKVIWDGDTVLNFYITAYNDPNILYSQYSILLKDLVGTEVEIKCGQLPEKFSIYTRRILKNYVLDIK
jgi:hypothetical protein